MSSPKIYADNINKLGIIYALRCEFNLDYAEAKKFADTVMDEIRGQQEGTTRFRKIYQIPD